MVAAIIKVTSIEEAYGLVLAMSKMPCEVDAISLDRHYVVDAKSILGFLSLDLTKPVNVAAYANNDDEDREFKEMISPYIIKEEV